MKAGVVALHELFLSLRGAGFTEPQAMQLLGHIIAAQATRPPDAP